MHSFKINVNGLKSVDLDKKYEMAELYDLTIVTVNTLWEFVHYTILRRLKTLVNFSINIPYVYVCHSCCFQTSIETFSLGR